MPVVAFYVVFINIELCFLIKFGKYLCSLLNSVNSPSLPKSLKHVVVNDHKLRSFTQSLSTFFSFLPHKTFVSTVCVFFTIFRSLSLSLYPNFTHFLSMDLLLIPFPLHNVVSFTLRGCFIYFKALPAKCSGNLVVALK